MASVIDNPNAIAVIGMSARFPGASTLEQFWTNLVNGVESITFFSDEELRASGVPDELIREPHYVPAASMLDGIEQFDARFFGFTPREAELTDPQHRLFLEVAWEAMESAGYGGDQRELAVGVFAGAGPTACSYLESDTHLNPKLLGPAGSREHIGNDKDYLTTRVSYRMNLRGPSVCVQTACSTSLVAVHLACQSLLMGESDVALAGGVTVRVPQRKGYTARDNAICSPDGHCRAFDAAAEGTVFGSGVGVVVLKRLSRAVQDGDTIQAVIRATAVNNDGGDKISYWASSVDGQIAALSEALAVAEIEPDSIGFVEAHGTGTTIGDPIEVMALTRTFRARTDRSGYCALGSVKTNVGHLDSAAGIVSLIKAILSLQRKTIPPTLHFHTPNPRIKFETTPFFVNTEPLEWKSSDARRALVNALGIGGTNACAVLEEPPEVPAHDRGARQPVCVLPISAKNAKALEQLVERYSEYFEQPRREDLTDVCFTAAAGRRHFDHRLACVGSSLQELQQQLAAFRSGQQGPLPAQGKTERGGPPKLALAFTGHAEPPDWDAVSSLRQLSVLAEALDECEAAIRRRTGLGLPGGLSGRGGPAAAVPVDQFNPRLISFALDYGLARQWIAWAGTPALVVGEGDGEVTAACVAGKISLDVAVRMLAADEHHWATAERPPLAEAGCPTWSLSSACALDQAWASSRSVDQLHSGQGWAALKSAMPQVGAVIRAATVASPRDVEQDRAAGLKVVSARAEYPCPWQRMMSMLADAYVLGARINWNSAYVGPKHRVVLPTYPFQKKSFWVEPVPLDMDHLPVVPKPDTNQLRRVRVADDPTAVIFECRLPTGQQADIRESCRQMMAEACQAIPDFAATAPNDWQFQVPDSGPSGKPWILQLVVRPAENGASSAACYGRIDDDSQPAVWHTLATTTWMPAS